MQHPQTRSRIGELARRCGVSVELLRAWEARYRLVHPTRTPGGFRLYSERDEARVRRMQALLREGLSAAEAARGALAEEAPAARATTIPAGLLARCDRLLLAFDEHGAQDALDRLFAAVELEVAVRDGILPLLRALGDRWATGEISVAQEHFSSALIRARLLGLARGWDRGRGPRAVLACAPGELHDIGLIAFGLVLRREGWRILYLGQDTPVGAAVAAVRRAKARALVVAATEPTQLGALRGPALALPRGTLLAVGGAGARAPLARRLGAMLLGPDLIAGARQLASAG